MRKQGFFSVTAPNHPHTGRKTQKNHAGVYLCLILVVCLLLIPGISAWAITVDETTETSIVWNVSQKPEMITALTYDGINVTDFDPLTALLIQSGLHGGEQHIISVATNGTLANQSAITNISTEETNYVLQAWTFEQINTWYYLIFIIAFMILALTFRRNPVLCLSLNYLAAAISLYALYLWMEKIPAQTTDILHLPFFVYIFFFIFPLAAPIFEKRR